MKRNPRPDLGAHAPPQLPDVGELARIQKHYTQYEAEGEILFWLAEHFWTLHEEAQRLDIAYEQELDDLHDEVDTRNLTP